MSRRLGSDTLGWSLMLSAGATALKSASIFELEPDIEIIFGNSSESCNTTLLEQGWVIEER